MQPCLLFDVESVLGWAFDLFSAFNQSFSTDITDQVTRENTSTCQTPISTWTTLTTAATGHTRTKTIPTNGRRLGTSTGWSQYPEKTTLTTSLDITRTTASRSSAKSITTMRTSTISSEYQELLLLKDIMLKQMK